MSEKTTPEPEKIEYIDVEAEDLSSILFDDDDDNKFTR
jgi:hypothetical protein